MAVFYVDDAFPEHPKAIAAGDEACWLYVCGLAYVRRNDTPGTIPKAAAPRLVTRKGAVLARQLVKVGLWHDDGDVYRIHDYEKFNAKSIVKREKARKAAETRWAKAREQAASSADADLAAMRTDPPSTCSEYADADANASETQCPIEPMIQASNDPSSSRPPPQPHSASAPNRDDEDQRALVKATIRLLAEQDLARRLASSPEPIGDRESWLKQARKRRWERHAEQIRALDLRAFSAPEDLAAELDPPLPAVPRRPDPLDKTRAADEARMAREHMNACPTCGTKGGYGWLTNDEGVERCPTCTPMRSTT